MTRSCFLRAAASRVGKNVGTLSCNDRDQTNASALEMHLPLRTTATKTDLLKLSALVVLQRPPLVQSFSIPLP